MPSGQVHAKARGIGSYPVIVVAIAIGMAESNCESYAENGTATGIWQIEYDQHGITQQCALNAQCNANDALSISGGGYNWCQWATYSLNCSGPPPAGDPSYVNELQYAIPGAYGYVLTLQDQGTGTCLDAESQQNYSGGTVWQWACNSGDTHQQWRVEGSEGEVPILRNVGDSGMCLDAEAQQAYNGGKIMQWACNQSDPHQQWWFYGSKFTGTPYAARAGIHSQGTGKTCVDADSTSVGSGKPIFQWDCNQSDAFQEWN
jgi:hypothetical protein